jgi:hypothetical protein
MRQTQFNGVNFIMREDSFLEKSNFTADGCLQNNSA